MTHETRRLTIDLSRANTLHGDPLVHFSPQPEPLWLLKSPNIPHNTCLR